MCRLKKSRDLGFKYSWRCGCLHREHNHLSSARRHAPNSCSRDLASGGPMEGPDESRP